MLFIIFLVAITIFRLFIGRYFPLIGDEAFYRLWSKHLALSYVDHPPMIAYYIKCLTLAFGDNEFAIRLGALILVTLITLVVYKIGKELFSAKAAVISAIIFNLTPTFFGGSIFLVPQQPFLLFWSLSLYFFVKLVSSGKSYWWYPLGLSVGLGLLSDYVMILFFPAAGLYLLLNKSLRFWFSKKDPYLGALISMAVFSPVIIWNIKIGFVPLFYWGGKMGVTPNLLKNLLTFLSLEMVLYTPVVFFLVCFLIFSLFCKPDEKIMLLACFSAPVFLAFLGVSPFLNIGGHWPAAAYLPAILWIGQLNNRKLISGTLFFALLVNILAFTYYLFFYPTPQELAGREFHINKELSTFIKSATPKAGKTYYLANDLGLAGLIDFHGKVKVQMAPGRLKQFDLWGKPELKPGDNVIYFVLNESEVYEGLLPIFKRVKREPQKRLFTKDADTPNKTEIYHCLGYRGGKLP